MQNSVNNFSNGNITASAATGNQNNDTGNIVLPLRANSSSAAFSVTGTFSGTLQFEATVDGITWSSLAVTPSAGGSAVTSTTSTGTWAAQVTGYTTIRVRASSFASGTAFVSIQGSTAAVSVISGGGTGGSAGQVQFNNSGSFGGISGATTDGTNLSVTTAAPLTDSTIAASTAYADNNLISPDIVGWREDFTSILGLTISTSATSVLCETGWTGRAVTASGTLNGTTSTFANPGVVALVSGAANGDIVAIMKAGTTSALLGALGSNAGWQLNFIFKIPVTTNICVRCGLMTTNGNQTDASGDGMWVEYDTANANSSTDFTWRTVASGTSAYSVTNSKAVDTAFHHVRIRSTVAGTIGFTIDGGTEFTTTTDVSTAVMMVVFQVITRTSATAELDLAFASYAAVTGRT